MEALTNRMWQTAIGWREILTRILDGFVIEANVTPAWLRNPGTNRLLKLDLYSPEAGVAVRFIGLQGQRKTRLSDEEEMEEAQRNEMRAELCRQNGVRLINVGLATTEPAEVFHELSRALASASRRVAQGSLRAGEKDRLMTQLAAAHQQLERLRRQVRTTDDVQRFADAWRDREMASVVEAQAAANTAPAGFKSGRIVATAYRPGMEVQHDKFGRGQVVRVEPDGSDLAITISFVTAGERKFLMSLVQDKLTPVS